jgi:MFS transporter, DHA1 family, tetracycline resistance protein
MKKFSTDLQLGVLFTSHLAILFTGMGLFPILPVYAQRFGASPSAVGAYLAFTYASITLGTMLPGWLAGRVARKPLFLVAGLAGLPALVGMGYVTALWQLFLLTGEVWFTAGVGITLVQTLTGLMSQAENRSRSFGLQSLASPLAALLGGATVGWMVDAHGFRNTFVVLALVWFLWPLLSGVLLRDPSYTVSSGKARVALSPGQPESAKTRASYPLVMVGVLLAALAISAGRLGLSMTMNAQHYKTAEISSTTVVSGLMVLPLLMVMRISVKRLGSRFFLFAGFAAAVVGIGIVIFASRLQHFWVAAVLLLAAQSINRSMSYAFAAEILSPAEMSKKLPWAGTSNWAASIAGFASIGPGMLLLGNHLFFTVIALLPLLAMALIGYAAPRETHYSSQRSIDSNMDLQVRIDPKNGC